MRVEGCAVAILLVAAQRNSDGTPGEIHTKAKYGRRGGSTGPAVLSTGLRGARPRSSPHDRYQTIVSG